MDKKKPVPDRPLACQFVVNDQLRISQSRDEVWRQLNDPGVLAECIRGCSRVDKPNETEYDAVIEAHIGRFRREFKVALTVEDAHAPQHYQLHSGMSAGFFGRADGVAEVTLSENDGVTLVDYRATIGLDGLLSKAMPLIEPLARGRVREFFNRFEDSF